MPSPPKPNKLRAARLQRNMTRSELARKSGVCLRTVWSIENRHTPCRMGTQRKLLRALRIPFEDRLIVFPERNTNDLLA